MSNDIKIQVHQDEFLRFSGFKKEHHLTDTQAMKELLDLDNGHEREINLLSDQLRTYRQRELKALTIGDAIFDGIYVTDGQGIVLEVNKRFCQLVALNPDQLVGKSVRVLVEKAIISQPVALEVIKRKTKLSKMSTIRNTGKQVLATGNPYFNDSGELVQILVVMRDITELIKLKEELEEAEEAKNRYLKELELFRLEHQQTGRMIGQSAGLLKIKQLISQIAQVESTVLITGETGVGKEVVARGIFENSRRKKAPYIRINCAAMPESLMESELFGYERGAFTGARVQGKPGMFEQAHTGTILLDEIGDLPVNLQPKLLRVLQEREVTRVGDTKPIQLDIRVLATTNQNLVELVKQGKFRKDLFYRLNVIPIHIPPLKDRREDIPLLVEHFLNLFNTKYDHQATLDASVMAIMQNYPFPGNVRELKNIVERLVVTGTSRSITASQFLRVIGSPPPEAIEFDPEKMNLKEVVSRFERNIVRKAIKEYGSTYKAARVLGISQPSAVRKARSQDNEEL